MRAGLGCPEAGRPKYPRVWSNERFSIIKITTVWILDRSFGMPSLLQCGPICGAILPELGFPGQRRMAAATDGFSLRSMVVGSIGHDRFLRTGFATLFAEGESQLISLRPRAALRRNLLSSPGLL